MHNTIHFWYRNWEKVCMKRSWQREDAKKGGPALCTDKNFIRNWFLVFKLGYSRKKMGVEHILFWEKQLKFLGLLFHPWKFWTKQNYSSQKILQNCMTPIENEAKFFVIFSLLPLKILVISCLASGSSTLYFFKIPGKSKSWNSQLHHFTWTDKLLIMKFLGE